MAIDPTNYNIAKTAGTVTLTYDPAATVFTATYQTFDPITGQSAGTTIEQGALSSAQQMETAAQTTLTQATTLVNDMTALLPS